MMTTKDTRLPKDFQEKSYATVGEAMKTVALEEELQGSLARLEEEVRSQLATYKLEVVFAEERRREVPVLGVIVVWKNGGSIYGGGDEAIYFCPGTTQDEFGHDHPCYNPIDLKFVGKIGAVCDRCRSLVSAKNLFGQIMFRSTLKDLATLVTRVFHCLGDNADVRMGFMDKDICEATAQEQARQMHGDRLNALRMERRWVDYALSAIIRDTIGGADIEKRFRAFLEA